MIKDDVRSILKQGNKYTILLAHDSTPKYDFNGNLHVAPEQITRISCHSKILFDREWYTADGKSIILKLDSVTYSPAVSEQNKYYRWEVVEEAKINMHFSVKGGEKKFSFSEINYTSLESYVRNQIFKGGRITQKRLSTLCKVMQEQSEYLLVSHDGEFSNINFDSICTKVQKTLKIK